MTTIDREFFEWYDKTFGKDPLPNNWKQLYAEHLLATKTKSQIWKMLCGPAKKSCICKCPCAAGIAWNVILEKEKETAPCLT